MGLLTLLFIFFVLFVFAHKKPDYLPYIKKIFCISLVIGFVLSVAVIILLNTIFQNLEVLIMLKTKKKGFTIVELVIVIAVIAILAAVLIPTFATIIKNAEKSNAMQVCKSAYSEYLSDVGKGKVSNMANKKFVYDANGDGNSDCFALTIDNKLNAWNLR